MPITKKQRRLAALAYRGDAKTSKIILCKKVSGCDANPGDDVTEQARTWNNIRLMLRTGVVEMVPAVNFRDLGNSSIDERPEVIDPPLRVVPTIEQVMEAESPAAAAHAIVAREQALADGKSEEDANEAATAALEAYLLEHPDERPSDGDGDGDGDGDALNAAEAALDGAEGGDGAGDGDSTAGDPGEPNTPSDATETTAEPGGDGDGDGDGDPAPAALPQEIQDLKRLTARTAIGDIRGALAAADVKFDDEQSKHKPTLLKLAAEKVLLANV